MARIILGPNVRFSYANVYTPAQRSGKYEVDILIHKSDQQTLSILFNAFNDAMVLAQSDKRFATIGPQHPSFNKALIKDGDIYKPNDHTYAGHYYFKAKSKDRPEVVGLAKEPLAEGTQFYSGCYGYVSIELGLYAPSPKAPESGYGINANLGNIQKVKDGERLSGGASAESEFQVLGAPANFPGVPAAAPAQAAPYNAPAQAAPQQPWQQPAPTAAPPQQFNAPAANPLPWQQQAAPAPQQQAPPAAQPFPQAPANPFAQPQQQGPPAAQPFAQPGQPVPGVNPQAPQAPWPPTQAAPQQPWQQQFPQ